MRVRERLEIGRNHEDDFGVVECLERIGSIHESQGHVQEALSMLCEAVGIATRSGDRLGLTITLLMVGSIRLELEYFVKAAEALSEAIKITRSIGWKGELSARLLVMGRLKTRLGEYREVLQESISTAREVRERWRLAQALEELVDCFRKQSKLHEAAPLLEEACCCGKNWHNHRYPKISPLLF